MKMNLMIILAIFGCTFDNGLAADDVKALKKAKRKTKKGAMPNCQTFLNEVSITNQGFPSGSEDDPFEQGSTLTSTGIFDVVNWESEGNVKDILNSCTMIQLGEIMQTPFGNIPATIVSECSLPLNFDDGGMMIWQGVETIDFSFSPPYGGSKLPFVITGGLKEWAGATGEGLIECVFTTPPACIAKGIVCKSDFADVVEMMPY